MAQAPRNDTDDVQSACDGAVRIAPPEPVWLDTLQAWKHFAASRPKPPDLADCAPMGTTVTENDRRLVYHGTMRTVRTPAINKAFLTVEGQIRANRLRTGGVVGVIIDGPRNTGKKVMLREIGLRYERKIQRLYAPDDNRIPVVALSVPAPARNGMRNWPAAFASFLGLERDGGSDPTRSICHVMRASGTKLILIDGIEQLRSVVEIEQSFEYLELIGNRTGAMFVYCGRGARAIVDPMTRDRETELVEDEQPWGDHQVLRTRRIDYSDAGRMEFAEIVARFDRDLRLFRHLPGDLLSLTPQLHARSRGYMRALSQLVCQAAQTAILTGRERITEELLESVPLGRVVEL